MGNKKFTTNQEKQSLFDKIVSKQNIYNAIYCLESYVFEKGLLDTNTPVINSEKETLSSNDLELYFALADKYNHKLISKVIDICKHKLEEVLKDDEVLFDTVVYFKLKGLDEDGKTLKFRPFHTARLTDMICMVSILTCLMFEDTDEGRHLSDLSKLVPHNFYGNVPSTNVDYLFKRWQNQYQAYTENVIEHCRRYKNNHRFLTEVSLDIKNFFPSVSPQFLYDYILNKLSNTYTDDADKETLGRAVSKLLFFNVKKENIEHWVKHYYGLETINAVDDGGFMNCGIPQGLPQSYFFGNLCMLEVKKLLLKEDIFRGDAYFYVDDSVIYIQAEIGQEEFRSKVEELNKRLERFCKGHQKSKRDIKRSVSKKYLDFQAQLSYIIEFHKEGKSTFCHIDDTESYLNGMDSLRRETSLASSLYQNLDDIDDTISYRKLSVISNVIAKEITRLKVKSEQKDLCQKESSRLKMLKRFKKFHLYRMRMLRLKTAECSIEDLLKEFEETFLKQEDLNQWFENNEEEIFQSEYRLLLQKLSIAEAENFSGEITEFEKTVCANVTKDVDYLYFRKDIEGSLLMKGVIIDTYASLKLWIKEDFRSTSGLLKKNQFNAFKRFLFKGFRDFVDKGFREEEYTRFIAKNSPEYQRKILNAFYSACIGVMCSDSFPFVKENSRTMNYTELRILTRLRNRHFCNEEFYRFIDKLVDRDVTNQMTIDMALLSVLGTFVNYVKNPEWIDGLILTHRITKGLWCNGSKFLNSYTLHNEEHAVTLINQSVHIVKTIDYLVIKNVDYYILFLACYLHDISMVLHPDMYILGSNKSDSLAFVSDIMLKMKEAVDKFYNLTGPDLKNSRMKESGTFLVTLFNGVYEYFENRVRTKHPKDSATFIVSKSSTLLGYLESTLLSFVAGVSESHGYEVNDVYGLKSKAKNDTVSLKYLMILIRLADLFDVANERVNYYLLRQNLEYMSEPSKFHWISHLVTDKLEFVADYTEDSDKTLVGKPIIETLIVDLFLNVKCLTAMDNKQSCRFCQASLQDKNITIEIKGDKWECTNNSCTLLCWWMMKKNEWLIPELKALNDYLYAVNNSLIRTNIKLRINYADEMQLDPDLFDCVVDYLQEIS